MASHPGGPEEAFLADLQHLEEVRVGWVLGELARHGAECPADLAGRLPECRNLATPRDDPACELVAVGHQRPRFQIAEGVQVGADVRERALHIHLYAELAALQSRRREPRRLL